MMRSTRRGSIAATEQIEAARGGVVEYYWLGKGAVAAIIPGIHTICRHQDWKPRPLRLRGLYWESQE